ncbi:disulfide bond formation protein B [Tabrizicola sp.]|uniref:disulfide bond formation protein B n=1 Tax=Tabrizicola sp. TaxID=2005166 RepID=UPI003D2E4A40
MTLTRNFLALIAMAGSAGLLLGALAFEHLGGLYPCVLCIWQRWPHVAALAFGLVALKVRGPVLPILAGLAALTSAGIGVYHTGVEQDWWPGLLQCAVNTLADVSAADLLNTEVTVGAPAACDKIAWSFLGLSMPAWNVIASSGIAAVWALTARRA